MNTVWAWLYSSASLRRRLDVTYHGLLSPGIQLQPSFPLQLSWWIPWSCLPYLCYILLAARRKHLWHSVPLPTVRLKCVQAKTTVWFQGLLTFDHYVAVQWVPPKGSSFSLLSLGHAALLSSWVEFTQPGALPFWATKVQVLKMSPPLTWPSSLLTVMGLEFPVTACSGEILTAQVTEFLM